MGQDVRVAVVGCGYWGKNLVRNFAELGALEALVDAHRPSVDALIAKHGGRAAYFRRRRSRTPTVNAVAIAAPAELHYPLAKAALEAGKHVFVEKPLALEIGGGEGTLRARRAPRSPARWSATCCSIIPAFLELKKLVRDGRLGRLAVHLFEPPEPRKDPPRGGHPLVLRAARPLDDPVARRGGTRQGRGCRRLLPPPVHRRRDDDASRVSRRRARARFRLLAAPVQGTEARRCRIRRHGGFRRRRGVGPQAAALSPQGRVEGPYAGSGEGRCGSCSRSAG